MKECPLCGESMRLTTRERADHIAGMQAGLVWFGRGYVEYKFPNNAKVLNKDIRAIDFSLELSSEVPGTNPDWPSDITLWVNRNRHRNLDSLRLRRQARRLHAGMVEARGLAIWYDEDLADLHARNLHRRYRRIECHAQRSRACAASSIRLRVRHHRECRPYRRLNILAAASEITDAISSCDCTSENQNRKS